MSRLISNKSKVVASALCWLVVLHLNACATTTFATVATVTPEQAGCVPLPTFTPDLRPTITPLRTHPTAALPPTAGPRPPFETPAPFPTLSMPLSTREQVLEKLLEYNRGNQWDEIWCVESLGVDPDRFGFQHFQTFNAAGSLGHRTYGGEYEPVWVVTIRGPVLPLMIGWRSSEKAAYLTYILGEYSGVIYGMSAGRNWPPPTDPPTRTRDPAKKTRIPRSKTPGVINTPVE